MGQILVRKIDDAVVLELKRQASEEGISLEERARRVLAEAARRASRQALIAEMDRIAAMGKPVTKRPFSEDLIREGREER